MAEVESGSTGSGRSASESYELAEQHLSRLGSGGGFSQESTGELDKFIKSSGRAKSSLQDLQRLMAGDGKTRVSEFTNSFKKLNTELDRAVKSLDKIKEGAKDIPGTLGKGDGSGSYTDGHQNTLPDKDEVRQKHERDTTGADGGRFRTFMSGRGGALAIGGTAAVTSSVVSGARGAFMDRMDPVSYLTGFHQDQTLLHARSMSEADRDFSGMLRRGAFGGVEGFSEMHGALQSQGITGPSSRGMAIMGDVGNLRQAMPDVDAGSLAGLAGATQYGEQAMRMRQMGLFGSGDDFATRMRGILRRAYGKNPTREQLDATVPGTAPYITLINLLGDPQMVDMVLTFGRRDAQGRSQGVDITTRSGATAIGFGDESPAASGLNLLDERAATEISQRRENLADHITSMNRQVENLTGAIRDTVPLFREFQEWLGRYTAQLSGGSPGGSGGGIGSTLMGLAGQAGSIWLGGRLLGLGTKGAAGGGLLAKLGLGGGAAAGGTAAGTTAAGSGAAGTTAAGTAATVAGGTALGTAGAAGSVLAGVGAASYGVSKGALALDEWAVDRGIFREDRYGDEFSDRSDVTGWDELDAAAKQARDPARFAREMGFTEPGGGLDTHLPHNLIAGADHEGEGYSERGFGGVKPHVARAGHYLREKFGPFPGGIGGRGSRPDNPNSDHPRGLALDLMTMNNKGLGNRVTNFLSRNAKHFGVKYIIWRRKINSFDGRGWRQMEDRGNPTANHEDHPHVSFEDNPNMAGSIDSSEGEDFFGALGSSLSREIGARAAASTGTAGNYGRDELEIFQDFFGGMGGGAHAEGADPYGLTQAQGEQFGRPNVSREGTLSDREIAELARYGGWQGNDLVTAVAVALAESRGNPKGIGDTNLKGGERGEQSTGLWQIHFRPSRDAGSSIRDPQANTDPHQNARNAFQIWQDGGWRHWSVHPESSGYTPNNSYTNYLARARSAVADMGGGQSHGGMVEPAGGLGSDEAAAQTLGGSASVGHASPLGTVSGPRNGGPVNVTIKIERASYDEAEKFAGWVKDILRRDDQLDTVGGR